MGKAWARVLTAACPTRWVGAGGQGDTLTRWRAGGEMVDASHSVGMARGLAARSRGSRCERGVPLPDADLRRLIFLLLTLAR